MWTVIVFFNVINRSHHHFLNFSHDFRLKIEMFVVSLIIDCNKMISFFKLIDVKFSINFCIEIIFDSYIDFKYFLNLFQSVLSTLYASFIKLSIVSIFLQIIENSIISWFDFVNAFSLIDQSVILLIIWKVAKVKSIINIDVRFWSFFLMHCFEKIISFEMFINFTLIFNQSINQWICLNWWKNSEISSCMMCVKIVTDNWICW